MQASDHPVEKDIVLVGGGHSHVQVLRAFGMRPMPGVRLTLICRDTHTPYSGMLPGYIAGHYTYDDVHIDLSRLAEFAGARFYRAEAVGLDRKAGSILCRGRPPVPYDLASINTGSAPRVSQVPGAARHVIPVKPIHRFNQSWQTLLQRVQQHTGPIRIAVVGAGAGGVELALAMQYRLRQELITRGHAPDQLEVHLFSAETDILPSHNAAVRRHFRRILQQRGIVLHCQARVERVSSGCLRAGNGFHLAADEIVWVTHAGGADWLRQTGLQLDAHGFIRVTDTLQSLSDPRIFAAGDVASMEGHPREKAGVFAVRQGRVLADNLRRLIQGRVVRRYRPQRKWLALISTGDRYAVASRGRLMLAGRWVWRWKDHIDRRFMARFDPTVPGRMTAGASGPGEHPEEMRCGGCGAKVGEDALRYVLHQLKPVQRSGVIAALAESDDAAALRVPPDRLLLQTVDFFRAFIHDPFTFGQITANHALGDIYAMGAEPHSASAVATVPHGPPDKVADTLLQMMSGALEVLNEADCALIGGHSGEGRELALGFAVNGLAEDRPEALLRKQGLGAGDALILTKPLGTGTLLAAHAQLRARGRWIDAALNCMRQSSRLAAQCLRGHGATACTDVTGFGLLGHLLEMTRKTGLTAELRLDALPWLDGALETSGSGLLSSLHEANTRNSAWLHDREKAMEHPAYPLLFDPQTAGGLLAGVPADRAEACLHALQALGYREARIIGTVRHQTTGAGVRLLLNEH
ncbi:MAG: selenide, water dikinase SelD [Ectothiorhodospiraceae bacterium]|nr:selenide, water dikinase SelD [Ectothiorhodospiraceae bacterium]